MAFHYYTGSDISEQREPAFWRREPRWPIGTFDGPAKMAMAGKAIIKILEYARKIPKIPMGWGNF